MMQVFSLWVPCELWTVNSERRMFWATRARLVREARGAAKVMARHAKLPRLGWVRIEAQPAQARRGGVLADVNAHTPVVKALVDGLVDAGVLADDTPSIVRSIEGLPPIRAAATGVTLVLDGEVA